uniref:Angiopoietin like 4 n=1 Tax=Anas platyrhynchos platyrhynchos TaxID=8840 RepID=A0A493T6H6_ANAPP
RGGSPVMGVASPCAPSAGAPRAHPSRSASLRAPRDKWEDIGSLALKCWGPRGRRLQHTSNTTAVGARSSWAPGEGCACWGCGGSSWGTGDTGMFSQTPSPSSCRAPRGLPAALPGRAAKQRHLPGAALGVSALQSLLRHDSRCTATLPTVALKYLSLIPAEGGWTVIQRRTDGSVDFDQLWDAYKNGFGDLHGDFWLGLEKIHHLVQEGRYNLLIELEDWEGNSQAVQFEFSLGGESTAYTLNLLGPLSGELENAIGDFRQLPFSTRDRDHDLKADTNCAKHLSGGWWFSTCGHANLNGKYFRSIPRQRHERKQGIFWKTWKGRYYPLKSTTMKIQPTALEAEP